MCLCYEAVFDKNINSTSVASNQGRIWMGLREYIIRRLLLVIPVALGAVLLVFGTTQLLSVKARAMLYVRSTKQLAEINQIIAAHHLNSPIWVQFVDWLNSLIHGNMGYSVVGMGPVLPVMLTSWPATIQIVLFSAPFIVLLGILLGVVSATHKDGPIDHFTRLLSISGYSLPLFWLALILIALVYSAFGFYSQGQLTIALQTQVNAGFHWHNYTGMYIIDGILNGRWDVALNCLEHLVLPVICLVVVNVAALIRITRSSMLEALNKSYVVTARAKGVKEREVINRHARRNALIPVVTISGLIVAGMMTGLVITETVFSIPGVGGLVARAAGANGGTAPDVPLIVGFTLFTAFIFIISNLLVDILYAYLDPRIRLG
jgi:peptide/nickel transport system permease protein